MTAHDVKRSILWFIPGHRKVLHTLPFALGGMFVAWVTINVMAGPGVVVRDQSEAEGPQFSDANTLDLVSTIRRNRVCPSQTQRWVWRWTVYKGKRAQQAVPLAGTDLPFLAEDGTFILTIPTGNIPDAQSGEWYFRSVTAEQCGFLPAYIGQFFRVTDFPVA